MAVATSEPAKLASGIDVIPSTLNSSLIVTASIAPSDAPAETPSVNGVASGLRSSAWRTTPAAASVAPTRPPARTRGSRATKKICASTLSSQGIERSNARASEIGVLPTVGAQIMTAIANTANAATTVTIRRRMLIRGIRRTGTTVMWPVSLLICTSASTS